MKRLILAALLVCLPVAIAVAQTPGAAPAAKAGNTVSLYGAGSANTGPIVVQPPKLNLMPTLEYMRQVINPHANAYWAQEGSLNDDDVTKVDGGPTSDAQWNDQVSRAATLMEAGNGLFAAGRPHNGACNDDGSRGRVGGAGAPASAAGVAPPPPARAGGRNGAPPPSCDAVWDHYAQQLIDGGSEAMAASRAHNVKAAFDAGSKMYDACFSCHNRYIPLPVNSRYTAPFPSDDEIKAKGGAHGL